MKKRVLAGLLAMAMCILTLGACGAGGGTTSSEGGGSSESGGDKYRVCYITRAMSDDFASWLANEMENAAAKYDDIELTVIDGQADDAVENAAIETAIADGYDAIIVQPNNGEAQRPYVEKIVVAGIIAITTNSRIFDIEGASSVDADPYNQAKVSAERAITEIPQNASVVVLDGPSGNFHAQERLRAWQEIFFDQRPDVEFTTATSDRYVIANWNNDEAMTAMENWMNKYDKIDAIISMNDNMALGALEACKDNPDYAGILAYGVDGNEAGCQAVLEGRMTSTCLQSAIDLAELNMATVHKLLTGEEKQIDTDIAEVLITKDNAQQYVDMYKNR